MGFTQEVIEQLGYYVYRLVDPRTGQTFYVGKGKGNRVFAHAANALRMEDREKDENGETEDETSLKLDQIRAIMNEGMAVIHIIHRFGMTENEALEVEAALIDCYRGLTNIQSGVSPERGVNNATSIQKALSASEFVDRSDITYCIIKIKEQTISDHSNSVYEAVRKEWRVNPDTIRQYEYVLACVNGIVRDVFRANQWLKSNDVKDRYYFEGELAPDAIREYFQNKKLPAHYRKRGASNPVQYQKSDAE